LDNCEQSGLFKHFHKDRRNIPPACFTKKDCLLLLFDDLQHLRRCHHYWLLRIVFEVTCVLVKNQAINGQAANSSSAEAVSGISCLRAKFLEELSIE